MDGHDGGQGGELGVGHGHSADLGFGNDLGFGHDYASGFGDHDQATVASEALMYSHAFSDTHGDFDAHFHSGEGLFGPGLDIGHLDGWSHGEGLDPQKAEQKRLYQAAVDKAKADPNRRYYGAHIVGHGHLDIPAEFKRLAIQCGLIRICNTVANFNPVDLTDDQISDWARFSPPYSRKYTPLGYYPGAVGLTRVFKQYWQQADKKPWWRRGTPKYDRSKSTYLEVSIVTWYYQVGDYETRIDLNIVSVPVLDPRDKVWAIRGEPLAKHQKAASQLCQQLFDTIKQAVPSKQIQERRALIASHKAKSAQVAKEQQKEQQPVPVEPPVTTPVAVPVPETVPEPVQEVVPEPIPETPVQEHQTQKSTAEEPAASDPGKIVYVPVTIPAPRSQT